MAKYATMSELKLAFPMMGSASFEVYHRAFCYFCSEIMGNEYVCWAAIQQFKHAPKKRTLVFIADTWFQNGYVGSPTTTDQSILTPINTGSSDSTFKPQDWTALRKRIGDVKAVQTWTGKLRHVFENFDDAKKRAISSNMLDGPEGILEANLNQGIKDRGSPFDTQANIQGSAYYAKSLKEDAPKLKEVTFDTKAMGVW
ncbi:MAG: hypothetical protein K5Q68_19390 [Roseococcus sp.]|nr:hypothetical protein [Roseococcus sp.]